MNNERFGALLEEIKLHPERHYQDSWISGLAQRYETYDSDLHTYVPERVKEYEGQLINCGTTGCLAGLGSLRYAPIGTKFWADLMTFPDGSSADYADYGEKVLELTSLEARYLFAGHREMDEILEYYAMTKEEREIFLNAFYDD